MKKLMLILVPALLALAACTGKQSGTGGHAAAAGDTLTTRSRLLRLVKHPLYTVAEVTNPWDTTRLLGRYVLAAADVPADSLPVSPVSTVVRTPLKTSLVYSGVHAGAVDELGRLGAITAVTDAQYFNNPRIRAAIAAGRIRDVGSAMSPSVERIVEINPGAILLSPYENSGHGAIEALQIPIIEMADYMESTPLGRAEWIKLLGELYGEAERADSIFRAVEQTYNSLAARVKDAERPMVITEQSLSGVWAMPGGGSYMARMLADAGATYPWAADRSAGSIELSPAAVLDKAHDAEFWFIRSYGPLTLQNLADNNAVNSSFAAFRKDNVFVCNTAESALFEEFPFHPELLLADFITALHPGLSDRPLRYYCRAE
ncbi:MAG: ABC transporter substrate-binding protein [Firmicutes bacterium]|nr:ABC transporter substrate-binding protein [Bacillota bacterium]MCM1401344.1 ABC transporter substrate-binding protein [Bacteroides sp.]MCM1477297.1 ABC transporter substrate-binding protein [Bacteroides sp.]